MILFTRRFPVMALQWHNSLRSRTQTKMYKHRTRRERVRSECVGGLQRYSVLPRNLCHFIMNTYNFMHQPPAPPLPHPPGTTIQVHTGQRGRALCTELAHRKIVGDAEWLTAWLAGWLGAWLNDWHSTCKLVHIIILYTLCTVAAIAAAAESGWLMGRRNVRGIGGYTYLPQMDLRPDHIKARLNLKTSCNHDTSLNPLLLALDLF